jgi:hypothetical protein
MYPKKKRANGGNGTSVQTTKIQTGRIKRDHRLLHVPVNNRHQTLDLLIEMAINLPIKKNMVI